MQKITNYLTNIFCNKDENEDENKISKELKAEVLKTFHSDPFEEEYEDKNMVYKYIKFIMTIKDKCPNIIHITQLQEFREFRKENPIIFCDSKKLDKLTNINEEPAYEQEIAQPYCYFRSLT